MKYVELRTGSSAESARTGDDLGATAGQSPCPTSEELRNCRPNEKKQGRQTVMPLTSGELGEKPQALPVVQPEDLLDEGRESHRAPVLRPVVRVVLAEERPGQHPAVVQERAEPEEEDANVPHVPSEETYWDDSLHFEEGDV